jgi:hypothetical protein
MVLVKLSLLAQIAFAADVDSGSTNAAATEEGPGAFGASSSVGGQVLSNEEVKAPALNPDADVNGVFGLRLRMVF